MNLETHPLDSRLLEAGRSRAGWSLYSTILTCPQKAAYRDLLKIQTPSSPPLARGSLTHQGLAHYYTRMQLLQRGEDPNLVYPPVLAVERLAALHPGEAPWEDTLPDAVSAVASYGRWWEVQQWEIVGVEQQLAVEISLPDGRKIPYTQRADLIVRDRDSEKIYIIDHKTSGKKDDRNDRAYTRSGQIQGYQYLGEKFYGDAFGGVLINYIIFYSDRVDFHRFAPPPSLRRVQGHENTIKWAWFMWESLKGIDPWDYPKVNLENGACEHRYGPCEYARLCDLGPGAGVDFER